MRSPTETVQALYNISSGIVPLADLDQIVDPDVLWIDAPLGIRLQGIHEVRRQLEAAQPAIPPAGPGVDCLEYFGDATRGVVRWLWRASGNVAPVFGLDRVDGTFEVTGLGLVSFRGGLLASLEEFWDGADLQRRLGATIPAPGSAG